MIAALEIKKEEEKRKARERARAWRAANPDRVKALSATSRQRRKDNWASFLERERERYQERRELVLERQKRYRDANPERRREIQKRCYEKAPHKAVANCAKRRAHKSVATPAWADKRAILDIYAAAREATKATGVPYEVDHIAPLRSKVICGLHVVENLRVVERTINRRKFNAVDLIEFNSEFQKEIKHGARWRENWRRAEARLADEG